jgi:glycosyltransferase involved in cell wall biosynthesis
VALLSYRSKPHCGGQGIYLRHVSRELAALGHQVEVFSGQPYPELEPGPLLRTLPSLDLYRDEDPFRTPGPSEYRDWIDLLEVGMMWTAAFPEPLTFSIRALRAMRERRDDFDIVHDNQVLAYGMLGIKRLGLPLVTSIHHPISVDRKIELEQAKGFSRFTKRRWYSFVRMQAKVARRVGIVMTGSESSRDDILRDFKVPEHNVRVIPLGVDTRLFHPRPAERIPGSIIAVASADSPVKGIPTLLRAFAKLVTERNAVLTVVGRPAPNGPTEKLIGELSLGDSVRFVTGISDDRLAELVASSEVAVVPSLYEGFSLPAVEHMASGTPLIASRTGALPEVTGDAAMLVSPGDPEELAAALRHLQDSPRERQRLSAAALARVQERFTWSAVARATVAEYHNAIAAAPRPTVGAPGAAHAHG